MQIQCAATYEVIRGSQYYLVIMGRIQWESDEYPLHTISRSSYINTSAGRASAGHASAWHTRHRIRPTTDTSPRVEAAEEKTEFLLSRTSTAHCLAASLLETGPGTGTMSSPAVRELFVYLRPQSSGDCRFLVSEKDPPSVQCLNVLGTNAHLYSGGLVGCTRIHPYLELLNTLRKTILQGLVTFR